MARERSVDRVHARPLREEPAGGLDRQRDGARRRARRRRGPRRRHPRRRVRHRRAPGPRPGAPAHRPGGGPGPSLRAGRRPRDVRARADGDRAGRGRAPSPSPARSGPCEVGERLGRSRDDGTAARTAPPPPARGSRCRRGFRELHRFRRLRGSSAFRGPRAGRVQRSGAPSLGRDSEGARPSSRPTRATRRSCAGSTWRSPPTLARRLGRQPASSRWRTRRSTSRWRAATSRSASPASRRRRAGRGALGHRPLLRVPRGPDGPPGDRDRSHRSLAELRGRRVGTLGGRRSPTRSSSPRARGQASSRSRTTTTSTPTRTSRRGASTRSSSTTSLRRAPCGGCGALDPAGGGRDGAVRRRPVQGQRGPARPVDGMLRAAMRDGTLEERIFRSWELWGDYQAASDARRDLAGEGTSRPGPRSGGRSGETILGRGELSRRLPPRPPPRGGRDARALVPRDDPRGGRGLGVASGRIYGRAPSRRADRLRRGDARDARAPAALRHLLRPGRRGFGFPRSWRPSSASA